jgi:peptidyl-dipeptidase Dcp
MPNPLTEPWPGPYGGVPPWDKVNAEDFPAAFEAALADERAAIARIAADPEPPTFQNTVEAFERAGRMRDRVQRVFGVMRLNLSTPEYRALDRDWQPKLAAAADEIRFFPGLFERIDAVYRSLPTAGLRPDQARLTKLHWDAFVRSGAKLQATDRRRLSDINQQLAALYADFRAKVMASEDSWTLISDEAGLAGLPESLIAAAAEAARERGLGRAWAILNTRSSVDPFLTFSARRDLREQVWRKFKSRGDEGDANDTNAVITKIVRLRAERAALLGYASHAHWQMAESMAGTPDRAKALLAAVWPAAVRRVRQEVAEMQAIAAAEIEPWDYLYYAERVRQSKADFDFSALQAYFSLERMLQAAMWAASELYRIGFTEVTGTVPGFHPDVRVWNVTDEPAGTHRGLFYFDTFARPGKRSGAWAGEYRTQHRLNGGATAIASNNNNFLKGAPGEPVLISLDDVRTLFHEFGHALHSLLQEVAYPGLSDTPQDWVELPSQINERWAFTRELLDRFARHHETGEPLPPELMKSVRDSERFNQGYLTGEALSAAILDLELHTRADGVFEPRAFERDTLQQIGMPPEIALRHRLTHFDHLFGSDAYSGLYYSYLWADVMSADGWQAFVESGSVWNKDLAARFRTHVLSDGNTIERAQAYRRFRGRDPEVSALLEERGLN